MPQRKRVKYVAEPRKGRTGSSQGVTQEEPFAPVNHSLPDKLQATTSTTDSNGKEKANYGK